ncbi:hypothetical protein K490DRAFT_55918 [Saccharata proteae CBS 121410]|uniref:Uncharacterized protein n=1 Tax=Saccharata proteae CBS 121410 TaxID=1314787 RepID=A0A9P4HZ35_9PEZI|nr:hypothetical protein K490DRAFT_55918 [Saccharata proteae CBS 121410]
MKPGLPQSKRMSKKDHTTATHEHPSHPVVILIVFIVVVVASDQAGTNLKGQGKRRATSIVGQEASSPLGPVHCQYEYTYVSLTFPSFGTDPRPVHTHHARVLGRLQGPKIPVLQHRGVQ